MAGHGHSSATGIDERTLGRIDLLLFDTDYADAAAAVEDAWRVAVLVADPHLRTGHEARTPGRRRRGESPTRSRGTCPTTCRPLIRELVLAFVLAAVAAAFVLSRGGLTLQAALLRRGLCASASLAFLVWLEPRRANSRCGDHGALRCAYPCCAPGSGFSPGPSRSPPAGARSTRSIRSAPRPGSRSW